MEKLPNEIKLIIWRYALNDIIHKINTSLKMYEYYKKRIRKESQFLYLSFNKFENYTYEENKQDHNYLKPPTPFVEREHNLLQSDEDIKNTFLLESINSSKISQYTIQQCARLQLLCKIIPILTRKHTKNHEIYRFLLKQINNNNQ